MTITREGMVEAIMLSIEKNGRATTARVGAELAADAVFEYITEPVLEMWNKIGDLEARNQRLWDEMAELDRELDDLTDWLPTEEEEET